MIRCLLPWSTSQWGDLDSNIRTSLDESAVKEITKQLLQGLNIMHAMGFAHRDSKPANIFVVQQAPSWWVKIDDFGMSKRIEVRETALRTFTGTHDVMGPEFFGMIDSIDDERADYTCAVDIWALGCITYRLCTQKVPFLSYQNLIPLKRYCSQSDLFPKEALSSRGISASGIAFIESLLRPEPSERLTAEAALALLRSIKDYTSLASRSTPSPVLPSRKGVTRTEHFFDRRDLE